MEDNKEEYTQSVINALQELESLSRSLAFTYVKNLAHGEFDKEDKKNLRSGVSEVRRLLSDVIDNLLHI